MWFSKLSREFSKLNDKFCCGMLVLNSMWKLRNLVWKVIIFDSAPCRMRRLHEISAGQQVNPPNLWFLYYGTR